MKSKIVITGILVLVLALLLTLVPGFYQAGTTDFYPVLTRAVAKNPNALDLSALGPGDSALVIKQARELGYKGKMWVPCGLHNMMSSVPCDMREGSYGSDDVNYMSTVYSAETRGLYQEYVQRFKPEGGFMSLCVIQGYGAVNWFVQAIQRAAAWMRIR